MGAKTLWIKSPPKSGTFSLSKLNFTEVLVIPTFVKNLLPICSACASLAAWAPPGHAGHPRKGGMLSTESAPSLSFGKIHPSHLLLGRKLHESGSKAGSGLGQSQYCAEPVAGARIGSTSPGRATFTFQNARAVRKQECSSFSGARSSLCILACASVESGASQPLPQSPPSGHFVLGWYLLFQVKSVPERRSRSSLGCSLISHAACLLFAPTAKIKAAFAGVVHSWLW